MSDWPHVNLKVILEIEFGLKCITLLFVALTDILLVHTNCIDCLVYLVIRFHYLLTGQCHLHIVDNQQYHHLFLTPLPHAFIFKAK